MTRREAMLWLRGIAPRQYADLLLCDAVRVADALIDTEPVEDEPVDVLDFETWPDFNDIDQ